MKNTIFAIFLSVTLYLGYTVVTQSTSYKSCQIAASYMAEKMWTCGMLRNYEAVAKTRQGLFETFTARKISDTECADSLHLVQQQTCQQYEMMVNELVYQSQIRNQR